MHVNRKSWMTSTSLIKLLLSTSIVMLSGCGPKPKPQPPPEPHESVSVAVSQVATSLCLEWKQSEPTWEDADTERTKDLIDLAIRVRMKVCAPYIPK